MAKRSTIGDDPLAAVVPEPGKASKGRKRSPGTKRTKREPKIESIPKERLTVHLPVDLIDRVKNAVYWTPGLTLAGLSEDGLKWAVERLEKKRGEPFPKRKAELKGGRPIK